MTSFYRRDTEFQGRAAAGRGGDLKPLRYRSTSLIWWCATGFLPNIFIKKIFYRHVLITQGLSTVESWLQARASDSWSRALSATRCCLHRPEDKLNDPSHGWWWLGGQRKLEGCCPRPRLSTAPHGGSYSCYIEEGQALSYIGVTGQIQSKSIIISWKFQQNILLSHVSQLRKLIDQIFSNT